jgi:hypothetical protein
MPLAGSVAGTCLRVGIASGVGATKEISEITNTIFSRADICIDMVRAPLLRLDGLAALGNLDSLVMAMPTAPNKEFRLQPVAKPIFSFTAMLYWPKGQPEPRGINALIGILQGQEWAHAEVVARGATSFEVQDNRQLLESAEHHRINGMILPAESFRHFSPAYPMLNEYQSRSISALPILLLVDRRFDDLVPRIDRALAEVKGTGLIDIVFARYIQGDGPSASAIQR